VREGAFEFTISDGLLGDFMPHIAVTVELRRQMMVSNTTRLQWPEET
jgi:hypothetical protein